MEALPVLSRPNTRLTAKFDFDDAASFERSLDRVEWLSALGDPSEWDAGAVRLATWDDWPGPGNAGVEQAALQQQSWYDALEAEAGDAFTRRFLVVRDSVLAKGFAVPGTDPDGDAWEPRSMAVWTAAWTAALLDGFLRQAWVVPPDLVECWPWFATGHWAAGYALDPEGGLQSIIVL